MVHRHFEWGMVAVAITIALCFIYIFGITPVVIGPHDQHFAPPDPITNYYDPTVVKTVSFPSSSGLSDSAANRTATCYHTGDNPWTQYVTGLDVWLQSQYNYINTAMTSDAFLHADTLQVSDIHQKTPGTVADTAVSHLALHCAGTPTTQVAIDNTPEPDDRNLPQGEVALSTTVISTPLTDSVADYYMLWHGNDPTYTMGVTNTPNTTFRDLSDFSPQVNWGESHPSIVCRDTDAVVAGVMCNAQNADPSKLPADYLCMGSTALQPGQMSVSSASVGPDSWRWAGGHQTCDNSHPPATWSWTAGKDIYNRPAKDTGIYVDQVHNPPQQSYLRGMQIGVDQTGAVRTMAGLTEDGTVIGPVGAPKGTTTMSEAWCDPFNAIVGLNLHYRNDRQNDVYNGWESQEIDNVELLCAPIL